MTAWRKSSFSTSESNCVEVAWHKSSFSSSNGNCVEVGWRKSSFSASNSNCLEVSWQALATAVRDSKNPTGPRLTFPAPAWVAFVAKPR
jgi:hypothetical protein